MKGLPPGACLYDYQSPFTAEQVFNRFCRVLEREVLTKSSTVVNVREVLGIIEEIMHVAPVFHLETPEVLRVADYCGSTPADLAIDPLPVLPFDEVVMANPYNACLLFDAEMPGDGDGWSIIGTTVPRWRCKFVMLHQEDDGWVLSVGIVFLGDPCGNARQIILPSATLCQANTAEGDATARTDLEILDARDPAYAAQLRDVFRQTISMALDACRYIDAPRHHLVVEEPRRFNHTNRNPKLPRADQRPRVRLVEPEAVRRIYPHQPGGVEGTRTITPHVRRGHTKVLSSPRYKAAQGRRIVIRPTWVGEPEWEHQGTRYRVVFRKPAPA